MEAEWDGFKYIVEDETIQWHINNGMAEPYPRELAIVKKYLEKYPSNHICIDVGGHVGTTALPYSRLFQKVIAFEPNPVSHYFFKHNIVLNHNENINLYQKGVYNKTMKCSITKHGNNSGCYYITESEKGIDTIRLDDMEFDMPVDFIKIDTEGSELYVLEGAYDLLVKDKPLINIETNGQSNRFFGYDKEKIVEFLKSLDYKVWDDDGNNPLYYGKME